MSTDPAPAPAPTGHVIVCGLHDEGLRMVEQLHRAGAAAVVVDDDPDPRLLGPLAALGVRLLDADARSPETLAEAGLEHAVALVCAESDDVHTLATALLAREMRPDLRVVVALRNAAVGRALADVGVAVLDVARLAAPAIARDCLRTDRWTLDLDGQEYVVVQATCLADGTLRDLYGDLTPVAVVPAARAVELAPGRDTPVAAGDTVVVLGTTEDVDGAGLSGISGRRAGAERAAFVGARAPREPRVRRRSWLRQLVSGLDRRVKRALLALVVLALTSVVVLRLGYRDGGTGPGGHGGHMSVLDAVYFTVETIGTVGFGDFYFRDQPDWLRVWAIVLMVVGATLATTFFALLTNALVSRRLEETLGRRRVTGLDDHVVVVGVGSVGIAVARRMRAAGVDVVVVETDGDNRRLAELRAARIPAVVADATLPETWRMLHLERARAVAVVTSDDLVNIETGLAVRDRLGERWSEVPVVLRVFDRRLAATVAGSFGFRSVRSPAALAAPWFVGAALGLDVLDTFYVGDRLVLVARLVVSDGGNLVGRALLDLGVRLRVVTLTRADGTVEHPPRRGTRLAAGDTAYLVGPYDELLALLREHRPAADDGRI